ncbi:MAG: class I SAM-dependent methyltransferase [Patescibacteria group bacterium]
MSTKYDQNKLDSRFNKESRQWQQLYLQAGEKKFSYNNKKYRQQYVLGMLGKGEGKVLDLGCGAGSYFEFLEVLGYEVTGLDSSEEMVKIASDFVRTLHRSQVIKGNVLEIPFEDNTFSAVIAVGLLEYLPDDREFLEVIRKVLKPGGKAVVTLRNSLCLERKLWKFYRRFGLDVNKADYFYREHSPRKLKKLIESMGFEDIQIKFCHFYPLMWPLSRLFFSFNNFLAHKMEKYFSGSFIDFLGSTFIISFRKSK